MSRKGISNEARWSEILEIAESVFVEKGYESSTMQEIAARAGLLKGSIYYYARNKSDLLYQVLARANAEHLRRLQEDRGVAEGEERLTSPDTLRQPIKELLKDILSQGVDEGAFDPAVDREVATNSIVSLMCSAIRWNRPQGQRSFREVGEFYKIFLLKGLSPGALPARAAVVGGAPAATTAGRDQLSQPR